MKKIKFIGFLIITLGLFFTQSQELLGAFNFQTVCQSPLTRFSSGGSTFNISFPPGGGTTCDAIDDCPAFKVPDGATIYSIKVDMELTDPNSEIGTPYIWVPISIANGYIAQIDTRDGFEAEIARYKVGNNPSRTFVIPGGDVWVANRDSGNVTKLSPLTGNQSAGGTCGDGSCGTDETIYSCSADCTGNICGDGTGTCKDNVACGSGTENCKEYKVVGNYPTGGGPRGVTGDINGFVWVGNYSNGTIVKLDPVSGAILQTVAVGGNPYGLIADQFGYVWVSNRGTSSVQAIDINTYVKSKTVAIPGPYGIGIDSEGNILEASLENNQAYKINGFGTGSPGTIASGFPANLAGGASTRGRGIASDLNNNIWVGSDNGGSGTVYSFKPSGAPYCPFYNPSPQHNTVGVAVDSNNNIWVVPYDGNVLKLKPNNVSACTAVTPVATVSVPGGLLYNYSDMTGLRTVPKTLTIGPGNVIPLSDTGTFEICSDSSTPSLCSDSSDCNSLFLPTNCGSPSGQCEIPLKIFSMQAGDYTLKNLEVVYAESLPVTTGGLVPCGREWNDLSTPWNETQDCNMCHIVILTSLIINFLLELIVLISILALIVAGLIYVKTGGDSGLIMAAKQNVNKILYGFVIVFAAWAIINLFMILLGFNDPIGDGSWKKFSCEVDISYCGDGIVNGKEVCEPGVSPDQSCTTTLSDAPAYCGGAIIQGTQSCNDSCTGWNACVASDPIPVSRSIGYYECSNVNTYITDYACCDLVGCGADKCCGGANSANASFPGGYTERESLPFSGGNCKLGQKNDNDRDWVVSVNHTTGYYQCWK